MDKTELLQGIGGMRSMMEEMGAQLQTFEEAVNNMEDEIPSPVAHANVNMALKLRQMADSLESPEEFPPEDLLEEPVVVEDVSSPVMFPVVAGGGDYILSDEIEVAMAIRRAVRDEEMMKDDPDSARVQKYTEHVNHLRDAEDFQGN